MDADSLGLGGIRRLPKDQTAAGTTSAETSTGVPANPEPRADCSESEYRGPYPLS
jgi:hypothetical protein